MVDKNLILLQQNCSSVSEEVDETDRRLAKALKDRTEHLRQELERYLSTEVRNLTQLKENLEVSGWRYPTLPSPCLNVFPPSLTPFLIGMPSGPDWL